MIECLIYIGVLFTLMGVGYSALYRCIDNSTALRRSVDDITAALHAGERWRADVRLASGPPRIETTAEGQLLYLTTANGEILYRSSADTIQRKLGMGAWVTVLDNIKSSRLESDPRKNITAWRWELELQTRKKASANPSRILPLFTFIAVPPTGGVK